MDRAAKVTKDFLALSSGEAFEDGGLALHNAGGGAGLLAHSAHDLELFETYLTPSGNRVERTSDTELLLERDTKIKIAPPAEGEAEKLAQLRAAESASEAAEKDRRRLDRVAEFTVQPRCLHRWRRREAVSSDSPSDTPGTSGGGDGDDVGGEGLRGDADGAGGGEWGDSRGESGPPAGRRGRMAPNRASYRRTAPAAVWRRRKRPSGVPQRCELSCTPEVFIAIASGQISVGAAVLTKQASVTAGLEVLGDVGMAIWKRERFIAFAAEQELARKRGALHGHLLGGPSGGGGGAAAAAGGGGAGGGGSRGSSSPTHASRSETAGEGERLKTPEELGKMGIDEELVRHAKQQMRKLAEEGGGAATADGRGRASSAAPLVLWAYMWSALSAVSSEATRNALWTNMRTLRGGRGGLSAGGLGRGGRGEHGARPGR